MSWRSQAQGQVVGHHHRQSAQRSAQHRPQTEAGKTAVSANATKRGLSAAFTVLANEDQEEFDGILERFREQYQPSDIHQELLVNQMVKAQWQLARAKRLEGVALDLLGTPEDSDDPDVRIVNHILASGRDAGDKPSTWIRNPTALLTARACVTACQRRTAHPKCAGPRWGVHVVAFCGN